MKRAGQRSLGIAALGLVGACLLAMPAAAQTITYTYDALGRLITVTQGTTTTTYTYDLLGNRTSVVTVVN